MLQTVSNFWLEKCVHSAACLDQGCGRNAGFVVATPFQKMRVRSLVEVTFTGLWVIRLTSTWGVHGFTSILLLSPFSIKSPQGKAPKCSVRDCSDLMVWIELNSSSLLILLLECWGSPTGKDKSSAVGCSATAVANAWTAFVWHRKFGKVLETY